MIFDTIPVGQIDTNCYLIGDEKAGVCAVVDPGGSPERILEMIEKSGLRLEKIFLTHGHWDHVGAIPALLEKWPDLPVYAHEKELCPADEPNPHYFFPHAGKNQRTYGEGDELTLGSLKIQVMHTPGHSAGSVVLLVEDYMICGDTLFALGCGRWDLPGGDQGDLMWSLSRLGGLTKNYKVCPGHGEDSSLNFERKNNQYLKLAMDL
ncbi:MAG: MBL fold metallo-hydrolase [Oscillibacter sp.]|nr:MBL fold metallo-hydrolase [Oscillibacter sp.]